jgi:hypothetical protein
MMAVIRTLLKAGDPRPFYGTYEGMTEPGANDDAGRYTSQRPLRDASKAARSRSGAASTRSGTT